MVLPMLATLLPGLMSAGKKFITNVATDIASGKGIGESLKSNAVQAASDIIPGSGEVVNRIINTVGEAIKKKGSRTRLMKGELQQQAERLLKTKRLAIKGRGEPSGVPG